MECDFPNGVKLELDEDDLSWLSQMTNQDISIKAEGEDDENAEAEYQQLQPREECAPTTKVCEEAEVQNVPELMQKSSSSVSNHQVFQAVTSKKESMNLRSEKCKDSEIFSDCGKKHSLKLSKLIKCNYLKNHECNFNNGVLLCCSLCSKWFCSRKFLSKHLQTHSSKRCHYCEMCPKRFNSPSALEIHKRTHSGERPYSCDICSKSFTKLWNLKIHKRIHSGEQPFSCDICSKSFTQLGHLNFHKRIHSGEKPFSCDICSKSFSRADTLKTHKRGHSGERPFSCDICSKSFAYPGSLKIHKRIHSRESPLSCDICCKSFTQQEHFNLHKHTHSGEHILK